MCRFITLVAKTDDVKAVASVVNEYGRRPVPSVNASLGKLLRPGEHLFRLEHGECDCNSVLGHSWDPRGEVRAAREARAKTLRAKGWSDAKVDRWLQDASKSDARPTVNRECDSLDLWASVIDGLHRKGVLSVGLFIHEYEGWVETDEFEASRRDVAVRGDLASRLTEVKLDELMVFER